MAERRLYIAAYDISDDTRLRQALMVLKAYASGCQKSVFECFLTDREREALTAEMGGVIDEEEDRFLLLALGAHVGVRTLGIAVEPSDPAFYYVG